MRQEPGGELWDSGSLTAQEKMLEDEEAEEARLKQTNGQENGN